MIISKKFLEEQNRLNLEAAQKFFDQRREQQNRRGRPKGSGKGRTGSARLQFCVTPEFKAEFEKFANDMNIPAVELLRRLFQIRENLR